MPILILMNATPTNSVCISITSNENKKIINLKKKLIIEICVKYIYKLLTLLTYLWNKILFKMPAYKKKPQLNQKNCTTD